MTKKSKKSNSLDMTIDISMAENGGIVVKYFDRDEDKGDDMGPMHGPKTYTFKTTQEALSQIGKWIGDEAKEEKNENDTLPTKADMVIKTKNMGTTMSQMKKKGY